MRFPTIYEINTRIMLEERGAELGRQASLDDVPDTMLEKIAARGFSWLWLMGVWQTGERGREIARRDPKLRAALARELPDLTDDDVVGSPFAIRGYDVHRDFGGDQALARLRERLARLGIRLLLDFVPNHVAVDHPWVFDHPEFLIHGSEDQLARTPQNYLRVRTRMGPAIVAHGRDPNFDGWTDTVQLNYRHPGLRQAQITTLADIADRCDGVRCDMAMLLEPAVIARTWGASAQPVDGSVPNDGPFWPDAIAAVRQRRGDFLCVAEVYWGFEETLQQQGFDFTYDKQLYDRLVSGGARRICEHLESAPGFGERCLRFLENHDELRAATMFAPGKHQAAAVITLFAPGIRLVHEGQIEGRRSRVSMQAARRTVEPIDPHLRDFYDRLLTILARPEVHEGHFTLWPCGPVGGTDPSHDQFVVTTWEDRGRDRRLLIVVNFDSSPGRGTVALNLDGLRDRRWRLTDLANDTWQEIDGESVANGFGLDLPGWGHQIRTITPL